MLGTDHCGLRLPLCTLSRCPVFTTVEEFRLFRLECPKLCPAPKRLEPCASAWSVFSATLSKNGNRTVAVDDNVKRIGVSVMGRSAHAGVESTHFGAAHVSSQATASAL